jgi:hypothetical protein
MVYDEAHLYDSYEYPMNTYMGTAAPDHVIARHDGVHYMHEI